MKIALICIFLAITQLANAGTLSFIQNYAITYGSRYAITNPSVRLNILDPYTCSTEIDIYVRNLYWYYVQTAELSYVTHINHQDGLIYVHQYKNQIGTFMCLSKYSNPSRNITVMTFMRLGDGYQTITNLYEPIYLRPFTISMNLGWGYYQVPQFKQNDYYNWSETWAQNQYYKSRNQAINAANKCSALNELARRSYNYYLKEAFILSEANADYEGRGFYCQNTYVNIQGTWLVIGGYSGGKMNIYTFVRLGDGYNPSNERKCSPYPSIISWAHGHDLIKSLWAYQKLFLLIELNKQVQEYQFDEIVEAELKISIIYLFILLFLRFASQKPSISVLAYNSSWFSSSSSDSFYQFKRDFSAICLSSSQFCCFKAFDWLISYSMFPLISFIFSSTYPTSFFSYSFCTIFFLMSSIF